MLSDVGKTISSTLQGLFTSKITDEKIDLALKEICTSLLQSNVSPKLILALRQNIKKHLVSIPPGANKAKIVQGAVQQELVALLDPGVEPYTLVKKKANVILFVGLQGCGKTTSVCKYANYYNKRGFKVGIVCADTFRAGAFDQVKQNALKIKVPFFGSENKDPSVVASEGVTKFKKEKFDVILVDSSGRNTQEKELFVEMQDIIKSITPDNIIFVMDGGVGQSIESQARGFAESVNVGSVILTKMDGTKKGGGALSSVAVTKCPIEFIGTGEGMDDFDKFDARRFVNRMLGMGDVEGLFEKVSTLKIDEKELLKKIEKGEFHLRDFYDQFMQLMSLGPLKNIVEMIPGMKNFNMPEEDGIRKMVCIFDSLHKKELDSDGSCFDDMSRLRRVARGSGTSVRMVSDLLNQFRQISHLMKKMGMMPGFADMANKDPSKMSLTEKVRMKNQMKGMMPKDMFEQMSSFFK